MESDRSLTFEVPRAISIAAGNRLPHSACPIDGNTIPNAPEFTASLRGITRGKSPATYCSISV